MPEEQKSNTKFINVDLDLRLKNGLDDLLDHFGTSVLILHRTEHDASIELNTQHGSLDETMLRFIDLVRSLPPLAMAVWDRCDLRIFNIGIQGGKEPHAACFSLSTNAIIGLASIRAEIALTVYASLD